MPKIGNKPKARVRQHIRHMCKQIIEATKKQDDWSTLVAVEETLVEATNEAIAYSPQGARRRTSAQRKTNISADEIIKRK